MKKLFISQPMRGKSDEEIFAERQKAIKAAEKVIGEPVEVIDSFFEKAPVNAKPLWFLGKSLELLADADVAYFAPGSVFPEQPVQVSPLLWNIMASRVRITRQNTPAAQPGRKRWIR